MADGLKRAFAAARATRTETPDVRPGQVWADNDPRSAGRTLRVDAIDGDKAVCTILTNTDSANIRWQQRDMCGKQTRISLSRFKPTRTGYRLARDSQYGVRWPTGSVFAFPSREAAEDALREDGRGIGVLVACEYEPGASRSTDWEAVAILETSDEPAKETAK